MSWTIPLELKLAWTDDVKAGPPPTKKKRRKKKKAEGERLPRIVLHGVVGQELDTDTSYQRAIMQARYRMQQGEYPLDPEEWRLPHSPVPARPDYTRESRDKRAAMTERVTRKERLLQKQAAMTKWDSLPDLVESADNDHKKALAKLSFNIGQLETLPPLVAAALFHQSVQQPNTKAYVPFVSSAPVHNKAFSETEKRSAQWEFPGFCSGCARQELCYGCVKDPYKPHYHSDKPVRTGGGYTYFKRDKPVDQQTERHPMNWRSSYDSPAYIHYDNFIDFDRYDLTMRTGHAPVGDRLRDLNPLHDLLLRHHSKISRLTQPDPLPHISDQDVYKGRVTTTPLSEADSGRGGTVADSQENLQRQEADKHVGIHPLIQEEKSRENLFHEEQQKKRLYQGKQKALQNLSLTRPTRDRRAVASTKTSPMGSSAGSPEKTTRSPAKEELTKNDSKKADAKATVPVKESSKPAAPQKPAKKDAFSEPIFRDGTLILRDGTVVRNASILSDGSVKLKNGSTVDDVTIVLENGTILTDAKIMRDGTIFKDGNIVKVGRIVKDGTVLDDGTVVKGKTPQTSKETTALSEREREKTNITEKSGVTENTELGGKEKSITKEEAEGGHKKEEEKKEETKKETPQKTQLQLLKEQMEEQRKKTPKAFAPKKNAKPATVAKSPFSTDRTYDIPTSDGFTIHKSDKELTQFEDFDRLDRSWNEPTKFELKSAEKTDLKPWTAPKSASSEKVPETPPQVERSPSIKSPLKTPTKEPTPSPVQPEARPTSGDSGVDSRPLTARSAEPEPTKFEIALPPIVHTPSAPVSRAASARTGRSKSTRAASSALAVEGEGTFIKSDTPASQALVRRSESKESKEKTPVRSTKSSAKSVVIQEKEKSPEIPETVESPENTTVEPEPKEETPPPPPVVEEKSPSPPPREPTPEKKPPEVDWSKFRSGAIHYTEEEDEKKKQEEERKKREEEEKRLEEQRRKEEERLKEEKAREAKLEEETPKKKKEVVKKEPKKERKKPKRKQKVEKVEKEEEPAPESEPEPEPEVEPEVVVGLPPVEEVQKPRSPTPPPARKVEPPPLPNLEPPSPPPLPDYGNPERPTRELSKTLIEAPPQMPEPPKQRRPADLKRVPKRKRDRKRVLPTSQSVAPVSKGQLKTITDPLDYLAKYCIIHPDRLPHYERVFNQIISEQVYRYNDVPHPPDHPMQPHVTQVNSSQEGSPDNKHASTGRAGPQSKTILSAHERKMIDDMSVITRATNPKYGIPGMNEGDQLVAKINFTLDLLIDNYESLQDKMEELHSGRLTTLAAMARDEFPDVAQPNYKPGGKKKKKKKKKKGKEKEEEEEGQTATVETQTDSEAPEVDLLADGTVPDALVVARLDSKMLVMLESDPTLAAMNTEIRRLQTKLQEVDDRIEDLEDEKKVFQLFARDLFSERHKKPSNEETEEFMRKQSALYRKLHPNINAEMNLTELEEALQQLNQHLISEKEMQYIYHVLDIDGRRRIDIQLFSVIAALSEKVAQVDPFIRKLINKFDFEALDVKMEKSKELFELLDDNDFDVPAGMIKAKNLVVGLAAGGVAPENTAFVESKFNREKRGIVDFLDFLTYVPLFIEIHKRIIDHPLSRERLL